MYLKKDWILAWNDIYKTATVRIERIPIHLWIGHYILSALILIFYKIPFFSIPFVKKLHGITRKNFHLHKEEIFEKGGFLSVKNIIKTTFFEVLTAVLYPFRELNFWMTRNQLYYGDVGEYLYWKLQHPFEQYTNRQSNVVEFPLSFSKAKEMFPVDYERHLSTSNNIDIEVDGYSDLNLHLRKCDDTLDTYLQEMNLCRLNIKVNCKSVRVKTCDTCIRDRVSFHGMRVCEYKMANSCGIPEYPLWKGI